MIFLGSFCGNGHFHNFVLTLPNVVHINVEIHNVDLTLFHVATLCQPNDKVETTLKCLLDCDVAIGNFYHKYRFYLEISV